MAACLRDPCLDVGHCAVDALARGEAPGVALCAVIDDDTVHAPVRAVAGQRGFRDGCFNDAQIDHLAALVGTSDPSLRWVGAAAAARLTPEAAFDRASPAVPRDCTRPESPQDVSQGADCVLQAEALQHVDATLNESARKAMEALDDPAAVPWLRQAVAQAPYPERRAAFEAHVEKLSRPPVTPPHGDDGGLRRGQRDGLRRVRSGGATESCAPPGHAGEPRPPSTRTRPCARQVPAG